MPRRLHLQIRGAVQGVGFRPFVYRLACELGLAGTVWNDNQGVRLEVEGAAEVVERFVSRLRSELPPRSAIHQLDREWVDPRGEVEFAIGASDRSGSTNAVVLPDLTPCADCRREVLDTSDRRHRYPFTNCTNCGPRFSIIEALPYDRPNTTMKRFQMCDRCESEYREPLDRRFHAQPNACPVCGPRLEVRGTDGSAGLEGHEALLVAAADLRKGRILAVKGLGGFHLMADATCSRAVRRLRDRKRRPRKPLALMVSDVAMAQRVCVVPDAAVELLRSPEGPIVILARRPGEIVAELVAPGLLELGLMLPPTPLHDLLAREVDRPLVATSGNLSDEPICTDNEEAIRRLGSIADGFLLHDRPIARPVDDSVLRWGPRGAVLIRRARGLAPLPVRLRRTQPTLLAVGAHQKCAVALGVGDRVFLSQHIGDMETPEAHEAFERVVEDFLALYEASPVALVHDLHPDYATTRWAREAARGEKGPPQLVGLPTIAVQHHHAHLASCLAEHGLEDEPVLGVTWDGTGYGEDGTIWGGEFLLGTAARFRRVARFREFRLPGGERAILEPRRTALSLLWESGVDPATVRGGDLATGEELRLFGRLLERGFQAPTTTSAGRLFDGVSALAGLCLRASFEGQAAMELEQAADSSCSGSYPLAVGEGADGSLVIDWEPLVHAIVDEVRHGVPAGAISARFHRTLAAGIATVAERLGATRVALTGGCFQNRLLTDWTCRGLLALGIQPLLHREVPANDGGVSLGQIAVAAARLRSGED